MPPENYFYLDHMGTMLLNVQSTEINGSNPINY